MLRALGTRCGRKRLRGWRRQIRGCMRVVEKRNHSESEGRSCRRSKSELLRLPWQMKVWVAVTSRTLPREKAFYLVFILDAHSRSLVGR